MYGGLSLFSTVPARDFFKFVAALILKKDFESPAVTAEFLENSVIAHGSLHYAFSKLSQC